MVECKKISQVFERKRSTRVGPKTFQSKRICLNNFVGEV